MKPERWEWGMRRTDILKHGPRLRVGTLVEDGARGNMTYRTKRANGLLTLRGVVVEHVEGGAWIRVDGPAPVRVKA